MCFTLVLYTQAVGTYKHSCIFTVRIEGYSDPPKPKKGQGFGIKSKLNIQQHSATSVSSQRVFLITSCSVVFAETSVAVETQLILYVLYALLFCTRDL